MPRVVVTGMGVVAPIGQSIPDFFTALVEARSGVAPVPATQSGTSRPFVAAQVAFDASAHWPPHVAAQYDRATQFALAAAGGAIRDAALDLNREDSTQIGVYWGTGLGGATTIEDSYRMMFLDDRVRPTSVVLGMSNAAAANVSIVHRLRGPVLNFSTACSSSASSIGEAYRAIKAGHAGVIVAGGSEALITAGNLRAWDAMRALAAVDPVDPSRSCKPFAANRTGLVLGEGAAALVLEASDRAERRGARIYAEIAGYGNASDAMGISKPDADGQVRAIRHALDDAGMAPSAIGYVNAHGTATPIGDVVETSALKTAFGDHARRMCVSSTKAVHGHLLGGAGALEMVVTILALHNQVAPPTAHLDIPDPACDLDYVPNVARPIDTDAVMSNSFGFGGMNAVLIAKRFRSAA